jgi:hypothetical protein
MSLELAKKAILNGELVDYLQGKKGYAEPIDTWVNANAPTDWTKIIPNGIYKLSNADIGVDVVSALEESILKMLDGTVFDIYVAVSVFYFQLIREARNDSPFMIDRQKIIIRMRKSLEENENLLKNYYEWQGRNLEEGMWSEILRIDSLCKKKWKINIISSR